MNHYVVILETNTTLYAKYSLIKKILKNGNIFAYLGITSLNNMLMTDASRQVRDKCNWRLCYWNTNAYIYEDNIDTITFLLISVNSGRMAASVSAHAFYMHYALTLLHFNIVKYAFFWF